MHTIIRVAVVDLELTIKLLARGDFLGIGAVRSVAKSDITVREYME
jgi:predicted PP-loop superfamily ATPase